MTFRGGGKKERGGKKRFMVITKKSWDEMGLKPL